MGAQIGCEYALGGHRVTLVARDTAAARRRAETTFAMLVSSEVIAGVAADEAAERLSVGSEVESAARGCQIVVESLPEDLDLKVALLRRATASAPNALLASNTSSFRITDLGRAIEAGERIVGTHYWNPPVLMPLVEVVAGADSEPARVQTAIELLRALGKAPVPVRRDVPGFVWNRLQFALVREAAELVRTDVIGAEDLDQIVREGLARRWRHVGPLGAIGMGGIDTWNAAGHQIFPSLSASAEVADLSDVAIVSADPERDRRARDRGLAGELARREAGSAAGP